MIPYEGWLLKFAVSLSWRVLTFYSSEGHLAEIPAQHTGQVTTALETWRRYLLDEAPHPGVYEQHLLPLEELQNSEGVTLPPNINRYIVRSIDMDVVTGERTALVYTKLPRLTVVGMIQPPQPRNSWQGTRISAGRGTIRPRHYVVPQAFGDYMMNKAKIAATAMADMSERQQGIVNQAVLNNLGRAAQSESISAMARDVDMFGMAAFDSPDDEDEN